MSKFKNQFRVETTRLKGWDYSSSGWYFITICTKDKTEYFREVVSGEMILSHAGEVVAQELVRTEEIRKNVILDEFVIMPNHLHAIVVIGSQETFERVAISEFKMKADSLGSIVNQFKGKCTKRIRQGSLSQFAWQSRYFDHVIRNDGSLRKIRQYIVENPLKWEMDEYFSGYS